MFLSWFDLFFQFSGAFSIKCTIQLESIFNQLVQANNSILDVMWICRMFLSWFDLFFQFSGAFSIKCTIQFEFISNWNWCKRIIRYLMCKFLSSVLIWFDLFGWSNDQGYLKLICQRKKRTAFANSISVVQENAPLNLKNCQLSPDLLWWWFVLCGVHVHGIICNLCVLL